MSFLLQVESKEDNFGCYYLYENLKENEEDTFSHPEDEKSEDFYDIPPALPGRLDHTCGEWSFPQVLCLYNTEYNVFSCLPLFFSLLFLR